MKSIKLFLILLVCVMTVPTMYGQNIQIKGVVTDAMDSSPLPGVTILIKGSNTIAYTLNDGSYTVSAPSNAVLVFSYIGMETQEVPVQGRAVINLILQSSAVLEEVVVTAMGIAREKKSIGYASQEVKADQLTQTRINDLNNALVGKVSGVIYRGSSGATFDPGVIVLRGTSTLSAGGSEPIYVLDGVITNVSALNMDDVESVNVLKGPAATAIYGSRGGNGAVIITTKHGERGKTQFDFSQTVSFEKAYMHAEFQSDYGGGHLGADGDLLTFNYDPQIHPSYLQALNGAQYYDMATDESWGPRLDGRPYAPFYAWDPTHPKFGQLSTWSPQPTDNIKDFYRTGVNSTTNIAFSKSTEDFSTRVSFTNVSRTGIAENSDAVRRYFSINTRMQLTKRLKVTADYKYTYRKNHNAAAQGYGGTGNANYTFAQWFNRNVNIADLKDYKRPDGTFRTWNITDVTNFTPQFHNNPYAVLHEINRNSISAWSVINGNIEFDLIPKTLSIGATYSGNIRNSRNETTVPMNLLDETSRFRTDQSSIFDSQLQGFLAYKDVFVNDKLAVDARLFVEERSYQYESVAAFTRDGLTSNYFYSVNASTGLPGGENEKRYTKDRSVFGTGTVSWANTYYLDFSLRNDWTSTLSPEENSYLYGGLSLAILLNNYFPNAKWMNFWKIRGSIAQVGSTMAQYNIYETYRMGTKYGSSTAMYQDSNLKDPLIKPTISSSYEAGTEFRLFKNRLYGDINFYYKLSKNQIINLNVPPPSGYSTVKINAGEIENKGYEITLGGSIIKNKNWDWEVYANWSQNKNKLSSLDKNDPTRTQYQLTWYSFSSRLYSFAEVGKPIGVIRGSVYETDPATGKTVYTLNTPGSSTWRAYGDAYQRVLTSATEELGNVQPDATGGFGTTLSWKGFRLAVNFDFQIGGQMASVSNMFGNTAGLLKSTAGLNDKGVEIRSDFQEGGGIKVEGVTKNADGTFAPFSGYMNAQMFFSRESLIWEPYIYDASYLKMRELSLTYTVPASLLRKLNIGLSKASVAFNAQNPWLLYSGVPNIDPSEAGDNYYNYIEQGQMMSTRTFGFTVKLTF